MLKAQQVYNLTKLVGRIKYALALFCQSLNSIIFLFKISFINSNAFELCNNIETIYCYSKNPPSLSLTAFPSTVLLHASLIVPIGTKEKYQSDKNWGAFQNIIEGDGQVPAEQCEAPIISYSSGQLKMHSNTFGAIYNYTLSSPDMGTNNVSSDGFIRISSLNDGENVNVYSLDGKNLGRCQAIDGIASMSVSENIVIVKIGKNSLKVTVQ